MYLSLNTPLSCSSKRLSALVTLAALLSACEAREPSSMGLLSPQPSSSQPISERSSGSSGSLGLRLPASYEGRTPFEGEAPPLSPLPELNRGDLEVVEAPVEDLGDVSLEPMPWDPNAFSRQRKRMNVEQLSAAFADFTGDAGWRADNGRTDAWLARWATLGGPDFIKRVTEDLSPSALFHKVVRDAAIEVCLPLVERELPAQGAPPAERRFVTLSDPLALPTDSPELRASLQALLLRAHGVALSADAPELDRWVALMVGVGERSQSSAEAWRALCVATLAHPRFWSY